MRARRSLCSGQAERKNPSQQRRSGQAELAVLLAIVVIAAAVVAFTLAPSLPISAPPATLQLQRQAHESVLTALRSATAASLRSIESRGGARSPANAVHLAGAPVAVWQACDQTSIPSTQTVLAELEAGIKQEFNPSLPADASADRSQLRLSTTLTDTALQVQALLPIRVHGSLLNETFSFSQPTQLKQLLAFASDFSREAAATRPFESFTIGALYLARDLPTVGTLTRCGETVSLSGREVSESLEGIARYVLSHTLWWQPFPDVPANETKLFAIPTVSSRAYSQFAPNQYLADEAAFPSGPVLVTNTERLLTSFFGIFTIRECVNSYNIRYSLQYPFVVRSADALSTFPFQFAARASIRATADGMVPGSCAPFATPACTNLPCAATVAVTDASGAPLPDATVYYGACPVGEGRTNAAGVAEGPALCGPANLTIYPINHSVYDRLTPSPNGTYALAPILATTFHFSDVAIAERSAGSIAYNLCTAKPQSDNHYTTVSFVGTELSDLTNIDPDTTHTAADCTATPCTVGALESVTAPIPAGTYTLDANLTKPFNPSDPVGLAGGFTTSATIPPTELYLSFTRAPRDSGESRDAYKQRLTARLQNRCGLPPVSAQKPPSAFIAKTGGACFTCAELQSVASSLFGSTPSCSGATSLFTSNGIEIKQACP